MSDQTTEAGTVIVSTPQPVIGDAPATGSTPAPSPREWARANGYSVKDTGRLPKAMLEAYNAAHPA